MRKTNYLVGTIAAAMLVLAACGQPTPAPVENPPPASGETMETAVPATTEAMEDSSMEMDGSEKAMDESEMKEDMGGDAADGMMSETDETGMSSGEKSDGMMEETGVMTDTMDSSMDDHAAEMDGQMDEPAAMDGEMDKSGMDGEMDSSGMDGQEMEKSDMMEEDAPAMEEPSGSESSVMDESPEMAQTGPTEAQQRLLDSLTVKGQPAELFNEVWLNSPPLKLADLRGKVVIVEFWTYG